MLALTVFSSDRKSEIFLKEQIGLTSSKELYWNCSEYLNVVKKW